MNTVELGTTYSKRLSITSNCIFIVDHSFFSNIITSEFQGGGINIEDAAQIYAVSTLFEKCSSTNYGGAFFFGAEVCNVSKCCSIECYHTVALNWNLGGGGYIRSNGKSCHEYSTIIHCAPEEMKKYGAHGSFGIEGGTVTVENVNSTEGSVYGYLIWSYLDGTTAKFLNLENMGAALLYFYKGNTANVSMANMFGQTVGTTITYGAIFCKAASAQLDNIMFCRNLADLMVEEQGTISIRNSVTEKSTLWPGAIDCQTNAQSIESIALQIQSCIFNNKIGKPNSETCKILSYVISILCFYSWGY